MKARAHNVHTAEHKAAEALINYMMSVNGSTAETNGQVAAQLGISYWMFNKARRHAATCPTLGGYTIAHRGAHDPLVLLDPKGSSTSMLKVLLGDRTDPLMVGWYERKKQADTQRRMVVKAITAASAEAAATGLGQLASALGFAANDIDTYGDISPSTAMLLSVVGVHLAP